jgi:hypothetical protein
MAKVACSFCGISAPRQESKTRFVAGPTVFICRDCVDITIDVFADYDPAWAKEKIKHLTERTKGR